MRHQRATYDNGERTEASLSAEPENEDRSASRLRPGPVIRRQTTRHLLVAGLIVGIACAGITYWNYLESGQYQQSTDNAYVRADFVTVSPKLGGYLERVLVSDNEPVKRGQLLAVLDPGDYRANVAQAEAQVSAALAYIRTARRTVDEQRASASQAAAQVASAEATAAAAASEVQRYEPLVLSGAESRERLANLALEQKRADANLRAQRAILLAAQHAIETQQARIGEGLAQKETAEAQLSRATSDLDSTEIRSSIDGVVADKAARPGQYVQPAARLMSIVPIDRLYIEANFKETQVALMRVGQPAKIKVDALDGVELRGRVASFAPGTGAQFSVLPPENATGNFTKIVQRVPVRINIEAGPEARKVLRPGLSVDVTIDTSGAKSSRQQIKEESERFRRVDTGDQQ